MQDLNEFVTQLKNKAENHRETRFTTYHHQIKNPGQSCNTGMQS